MTIQEAKEWFKEELKDGKCSDTCVQCNANEVALRILWAWDEMLEYVFQRIDNWKGKDEAITDELALIAGKMIECMKGIEE